MMHVLQNLFQQDFRVSPLYVHCNICVYYLYINAANKDFLLIDQVNECLLNKSIRFLLNKSYRPQSLER